MVWRRRGDVRHPSDTPFGLGDRGDDLVDDLSTDLDERSDTTFAAPADGMPGGGLDDRLAAHLSSGAAIGAPAAVHTADVDLDIDSEPVWADDRADTTEALERDELDLTVPTPRPSTPPDLDEGITETGELGPDPGPPVDRL